ncbi:MAG: preprotein translocase subunit SecY [Patescibacteria group bacterium]|mgnify:CR=1 FL=1
MEAFFTKLKLILEDRNLSRRLFFLLLILALTRLGSVIPMPGIDRLQLARVFAGDQFLGFLDIFAGGGLSSLSIMMLGVGPFITASIIIQLLTLIFPSLKQMYHEDGEGGRRKVAQYSRLLTVPLAIFQSIGLMVLLQSRGLVLSLTPFEKITSIVVVVAGSLLLMWLGELISEYGIGNGVSLIIFAGIVAQAPELLTQLMATFDVSQIPLYLGFIVIALITLALVVFITEAERPIPITYAKRMRGMKMYGGMSTYLPIRVNNAGVMPIIFALSILLFPQMVANFLANSSLPILKTLSGVLLSFMNQTWIYGAVYFFLVVVFTYFYSAVTFDPEAISTNLQKNGAFIPGVRPGHSTAIHISKILTRLTLVGALFLGLIAVLPMVLQSLTDISALAIGGTSLLIVVSVALDFVKQIEAQITMREY